MKKYFSIISLLLIIISSCSFEDFSSESTTGENGSKARFNIHNNRLYTVDDKNLHTFNIQNPSSIEYKDKVAVGTGIETIFPMNNYLFLGANNGMYIYNLENPDVPKQESYSSHFFGRDPVVVQGNFAYVTVARSFSGVLEIYDVKNVKNPVLMNSVDMLGPSGLAIKDTLLFVCDKGIKIFNIKESTKPVEIEYIPEGNAHDLIVRDEVLYVLTNNSVLQYRYSNDKEFTIEKLGEALVYDKNSTQEQ